MQKTSIFVIAAVLLSSAGRLAAGEGTSGAQFLRIGPMAGVSALGDAGAAVTGAQSMFYNPAGLSAVRGTEVSLSHVKWIMEMGYSSLAAAKKVGSGVYGLSASYLAMPAIFKYDKYGNKLSDSYSASDLAVAAAYARRIAAGTAAGLSVKYISCGLDSYSASAFAADAGVRYDAIPGKLVLGASAQNLGTKLKYRSEGDPLPLNFKAGGQYTFKMEEDMESKKRVSVMADVNRMTDAGFYAGMGLEFSALYSDDNAFSLRAGYRTNAADSGGGLSFGLGMDMKDYSVDYAYSPMGDLGQAHRMSFGVRFGAGG